MSRGTEITSTGQMSEVAASLEELTARYNASVNKLYDLGAEVDAMWEGEASDTFKTQFQGDKERFNAMTKMLQTYIEILRQDIATYQKAEADAISAVKNSRK